MEDGDRLLENEGEREEAGDKYIKNISEIDREIRVEIKTIFEDILGSLFSARFTAPIFALFGIFLAYQLTVR